MIVHKKKPIALILAHAIGLGAFVAVPAVVTAQSSEPVEKVIVTGSAIKRTDFEGPAPLTVITHEDIQRTGASSTNELMRSIAAIDFYDQGELASNSASGSGSANIRMRNMAETNVLVLLNGRRLPVNALYDSSGAGAAVDVNTIPVSAIERVEILKDGASAIYGADAVAGVVNFITKKDYTGIEARLNYGLSSRGDGEERSAGFVGGFGNLDTDRYNVLFAVDQLYRKPIYRKDRDISKSADFTRLGGPDSRSYYSPAGTIVNPDSFAPLGSIKPCVFDVDGYCRYDFNSSLLTAYNGADRLSSMAMGTFKVTKDVNAFAEVMYSRNRDHFDAHPVPGVFSIPTSLTVSGGGSYPDNSLVMGRFLQGGPRMTDRESELSHFAGGFEGALAGIDWKLTYTFGHSHVVNSDHNYFNQTLFDNATANGTLDPTSTTNDPALVGSLKVNPLRVGDSYVRTWEAQANGSLTELPAGPLSYALGFSHLSEQLTDTPDALTQQGLVFGSIQQAAVQASRSARAAFVEFGVPILKTIEAQVAVRRDEYPNNSSTTPKVGFKWQLHPRFATRFSYSESFRPASLKQLYGAEEQGATNFSGADCAALYGIDCGTASPPGYYVTGSNATLKPERGKTFNLGFIFEPTDWLNGTLDYFHIEKSDGIGTPTISQAIKDGKVGKAADGTFIVFTNLQNIAKEKTSGIDLDLALHFKTDLVGKLTIKNSTTYYLEDNQSGAPGDPMVDYIDTYGNGGGPLPRWKNVLSFTSEAGYWTNTLSVRSTAGFRDTDNIVDNPNAPRVKSHTELDLVGSYRGFKSIEIDYGIKNLLDEMPPFSYTNANSNQYTQQGFAELYSSRGRFYFAGLNYKFR